MTPRRRRLPVIALATALLLAYTAQAKDLAEAIPQDAVVVLRAIGLHAAWQRFAASQAWKKLQDSQVEDVRNGIAEVKAGIREFETRTGVGFEQGVGAMFGADAALVLFADGTAACVARSSDPAMLRTAVETLHA